VIPNVHTAAGPSPTVPLALVVNFSTTDAVFLSVQLVLPYSKVMDVMTVMLIVSRVRTLLPHVLHALVVVIYTQVPV